MRYEPEHKERVRQKLLRQAAKAIREQGPDRISVATIMSKAGLTHGGFYAHFDSKDSLVDESIARMFDEGIETRRRATEGAEPAEAVGIFIDYYLTPFHRDARGKGCPLPALAGDLARLPPASRQGFEVGMREILDMLATHLTAMKLPKPRALATSVLAEMVGAVTLARAISNHDLSTQILRDARDNLRARIGLTKKPTA